MNVTVTGKTLRKTGQVRSLQVSSPECLPVVCPPGFDIPLWEVSSPPPDGSLDPGRVLKRRAQADETAAHGGARARDPPWWEGRLVTSVGLFPQIHAGPSVSKRQANPSQGTLDKIADRNPSEVSGSGKPRGDEKPSPGDHGDARTRRRRGTAIRSRTRKRTLVETLEKPKESGSAPSTVPPLLSAFRTLTSVRFHTRGRWLVGIQDVLCTVSASDFRVNMEKNKTGS